MELAEEACQVGEWAWIFPLSLSHGNIKHIVKLDGMQIYYTQLNITIYSSINFRYIDGIESMLEVERFCFTKK